MFSILFYSEECRNVDVNGGKKCVGELRDELDKCVGCIAHACCSTEPHIRPTLLTLLTLQLIVLVLVVTLFLLSIM